MGDLWTLVAAGGIVTGPMLLLLAAIRMMFSGALVTRQQMLDRLADRQQLIDSKNGVIEDQSTYIRTLESQVELLAKGAKTTLQVVEALPQITSSNRSESS